MKIDIDFTPSAVKDYSVYIDELQNIKLNGKVAVITNPKVSGLHLQTLLSRLSADECFIVTIPDGEEFKTLSTIEDILNRLFEHRLDRKSTLIAFGGGVIGDMTGFAASLYQRGIDFIQIPTTLLAQVDASVGGKTGINNRFGKNLVGAFHQPRAVYCQTEFLKTLPPREFSAGVAEIIKMAITFDKDFFAWLEKADLTKEIHLREAIARSVQIKASVVAKDEKEAGIRAVLNYGHTFAHVIENETEYKRYLHGEAVAIGMNMANRLAIELGLLTVVDNERICELLQRYALPTTYALKDVEAFYEAFFLDKKSHHSKITFILPEHIGGYAMRDNVPKELVLKVLEEFTL